MVFEFFRLRKDERDRASTQRNVDEDIECWPVDKARMSYRLDVLAEGYASEGRPFPIWYRIRLAMRWGWK